MIEIIVTVLAIVNVFAILYIRILIKESLELEKELLEQQLLAIELEDELLLQKRLAETFEKGYTDLKNKKNV